MGGGRGREYRGRGGSTSKLQGVETRGVLGQEWRGGGYQGRGGNTSVTGSGEERGPSAVTAAIDMLITMLAKGLSANCNVTDWRPAIVVTPKLERRDASSGKGPKPAAVAGRYVLASAT